MKEIAKIIPMCVLLVAGVILGRAEPAKVDDPAGVLKKPIPDKLIVLTFDDGPLSGYTVCAPILKSHGFGGSFYVCDFDSFKSRKDWYMTWRQMKAMADGGLEVGNHSAGHFSGLGAMMGMEDELLSNHVPKPTTITWPLGGAAMTDVPALVSSGYLFARGGYSRPYRPTVDNGFDIPSVGLSNMPDFVKMVRQAAGGRIIVIMYHGVPDMEHPPCSVDPAVFKEQMQYLKDNKYKVIALRDLAEYVDPVKASKLPPTAKEFKDTEPVRLAEEIKPYANSANELQHFGFPNLPGGQIEKATIRVTVPYALDVTAIAPVVRLPDGASIAPKPEVARDFSKPQEYTLTFKDGSATIYTVIVNKVAASTDKDMLEFVMPGAGSIPISSTRMGVSMPINTDVTKLAPTLTVSPLAQVVPASGTPRDFTKPQTYTVTAQDGSSQVYTVAVVKSGKPNTFTWGKAETGNWSDASQWSNNLVSGSAPIVDGRDDYVLTFNQPGKNDVTHDLADGFLINQLNLEKKDHGNISLTGKSLTFAKNTAAGVLPGIMQRFLSQKDGLDVPIKLASDIHVVSPERCFLAVSGVISGDGRLTYDGHGTVFDGGADSNFSTLFIATKGTNTYSGGTIINGGRVLQYCKEQPLGTGPVTLNGGQLVCGKMTNPLIVNGGRIAGGSTEWNAPITLNGIAMLDGSASFNQTSGGISGPGGLTMIGTWSTWSIINKGVVSLYGTNTYTGPTTILKGAIAVKKAVALYNADSTKWTPANIIVSKTATLSLSAGGPGEFTGDQVGRLLKKLTTSINSNGMMAGSVLCLDVTHTNESVTVSADIANSKGAGGGPFIIKKSGAGTLQLSGKNTYSSQTILESGTLSVASLNSVVKGKTSSSLGTPTDIEAGEIVIGEEGKDGECALIYTGTGETTDRVINLVGKNSTMTFDQSGSGLFKLTSDLWISGYGSNKQIALTGDSAGTGDFAGSIVNPYDRAGKATTSLTKSGKGTWSLSGTNSYTGPTTVKQGTLSLTNPRSLSDKTEVSLSEDAMLDLNFKGEMRISKLYLDGKLQPAGTYSAANAPKFIKGKGVLKNQG
ncbi:MAG: autotransporter-associated beta strand repeat-containing protein [Verrucomicrobia bacterium]|nr:autotransporter-associated beta strand repeat-containing protein [Verrucomicrobiota bacterium]